MTINLSAPSKANIGLTVSEIVLKDSNSLK